MVARKVCRSTAGYAVVSLVVLYLGYGFNLWRAVDFRQYTDGRCAFLEAPEMLGPQGLPDSLLTFDRYSEGLAVGRLVANREKGLFSWGGFVGWFTDVPAPPPEVDPNLFISSYQYKLYLDPPPELSSGTYERYGSHIGGQVFLIGVLDTVLPFRSATKLRLYYHVMALLTAAVFVAIFVWFFREFGPCTGWFLTIVFSCLCYPTLYARNLWWVIWAFYIPFVAILYFCRREELSNTRRSFRRLFLVIFGAMLGKLFFNGCEYITTAVVMAAMPLGYYAVKNRWPRPVLFKRCGVLVLAVGLAVGVFFVALSFQYVLAGETFMDGVRHIGDRFLVRTHGGSDAIAQELGGREAMRLVDLLRWYASAPAVFDLRRMGIDRIISMKWMMLLYASVTVIGFTLYRRCRQDRKRVQMKALLVTFWLSILAPCSWFVIFKGHSEVHRSLAAIIWYMPFMIYGMALIGSSLDTLIGRQSAEGLDPT